MACALDSVLSAFSFDAHQAVHTMPISDEQGQGEPCFPQIPGRLPGGGGPDGCVSDGGVFSITLACLPWADVCISDLLRCSASAGHDVKPANGH